MAKHITLVGMMGSGKSTVAPLVAAPLKRPVLEVDQIIEEQEGMNINDIFIAKGEAYFRRVENDLMASLLRGTPAVISPRRRRLPVGNHAQSPAQEHRCLLPLRQRRNPRLAPADHARRPPPPQHPRPRPARNRPRPSSRAAPPTTTSPTTASTPAPTRPPTSPKPSS